jgi:hypothetical protein
MQAHPGVTVARDKSVTRRVGVSRLSASTACLVSAFPGLTVHEFSEYATYRGQRFDATEFAEASIEINAQVFDIENACHRNQLYEKNESLFLTLGEMRIDGFKRRFRAAGGSSYQQRPTPAAGENRNGDNGDNGAHRPTIADFNTVSTGGVVITGGATTRHTSNSPSLMIGATNDIYEVRHRLQR